MSPLSRVLLLLMGTALLTACNNRLNTTEVEAAIKADIERQGRRLTLKQVTCPTGIARQTNSVFRCVGELKPEGSFSINVVQIDSQGTLEWDIPNSTTLLNLAKVEAQIQTGLAKVVGKQAVIDCGSEAYRANQAGDRFECQVVGGVTMGSEKIEAVLVKIDPEGNLGWQEIRQPMPPAAIALTPTAPGKATAASSTPTGAAPSPQPNPAAGSTTRKQTSDKTVIGASD